MKIILIDGNSVLNRAYFALPPMNTDSGQNVNAVFGFVNILLRLQDDYHPTHIAVAFDEHGKNFRHELYALYKANRKGMPDDLAAQMPIIKDLLAKMNIKTVSKKGVEADDVVGTLAKRFSSQTYIVSGDRDLFQLVDDTTTVLLTKRGVTEVETVTPDFLAENYHLTPEQVIEFKGLRGDTSDNIPGVKGIGEKTAAALLSQFNSIDNLYANIDQVKGTTREKLLEDKEMCYLSRTLATINTSVEIDCSLESIIAPSGYSPEVADAFYSLKFNSLLKRLKLADEVTAPLIVKQAEVKEIATLEQAKELCAQLLLKSQIAVYIDNDLHFSFDENTEYVIKTGDSFLDELYFDNAVEVFKRVFNSQIPKTVYDGKSLSHTLARYGIALNNIAWDVSIMQYLNSYSAFKSFSALCNHYSLQPLSASMFVIAEKLRGTLSAGGLTSLYDNIELPLSSILFDMEKEGVKINVDTLDKLNAQYVKEINDLSEQVYVLCGKKFNIASTKQLADVLFTDLQLPHAKQTKTGYSTDNEVLEMLADVHECIPLIIRIRQISKLNGTYIEGMRQHVKDGLIHTTYNQTLTSTGRLSSSEPNLQNIPIRDELGKEVRKMFVPKYDKLVSADYSQIELRLLAAFSGDDSLIKAFLDGKDIHRIVAAQIFGKAESQVDAEMRRDAKAVNFGIIYGMSNYGLSNYTKISPAQARRYIENYYQTYPLVKAYLDSCVEQARKFGYVTTLFGRRREIPEIKSAKFALRSFGERAAKNMPLQGSAADIIKIAMIKVADEMKSQNLKSKLIMQIHDELVVDCFDDEVETVKEILISQMQSAVSLSVPLMVNVGVGDNLDDAK